VGNAIRYAVDRGAKVINMSFGKAYSPNKEYVQAAFKYAEDHGVLLVHAAGNDHSDNDQGGNFPTRIGTQLTNLIEVGASTSKKGAGLPADFSNFGQTQVDLFAPGKGVYSTVPGNQYASYDGTSMASPEVAGVAALVLSQHPDMTPAQLRELLMKTSRKYTGLKVIKPGTGSLVDFSALSVSGGVVNAYSALKSALETFDGI
jgi:subtilisin family serine protease